MLASARTSVLASSWERHAARRRPDRGTPGRGAAHPGPATRPGAVRSRTGHPRLREPLAEARRRQGAGDPRHLRALLDPLLPTAQRSAGQSGRHGTRPGAGRPPPSPALAAGPAPAPLTPSPDRPDPLSPAGGWRRRSPATPPDGGRARVAP